MSSNKKYMHSFKSELCHDAVIGSAVPRQHDTRFLSTLLSPECSTGLLGKKSPLLHRTFFLTPLSSLLRQAVV